MVGVLEDLVDRLLMRAGPEPGGVRLRLVSRRRIVRPRNVFAVSSYSVGANVIFP